MSKKRGKEINLSEKLSSLIHTKPSVIESEDEDLTTVDKIAPNDNDSDFSADELDVAKFRKINNEYLDEDDKKYSGKGVSRKDLRDSDESEASEVEQEINYGDSSSENENSDTQQSDDEHDEDFSSPSEVESDTNNDNNVEVEKTQDNVNFNKDIFLKATSDIEKGRAIKNQLHIWDFLLECRMKFQKCLLVSNQLPNYKNLNKFKSKGGAEFQSSVSESRRSVTHLLNSLLAFQDVLLKSSEDYVNSSKTQKIQTCGQVDEEIESDSDIEDDRFPSTKKTKKLNDFSDRISKAHETFRDYRNSTIQKWNDKTRISYISNKNFSAFEQSTVKQIEHVLLDKERLIKRTQTKRTNYHILGQEDQEPPLKKTAKLEESSSNVSENKNKTLEREIFDDDDFYHQLLSDLVKRKASDVSDPVQLGKQWMQLQKVRSKMKKTVDVKASKGRKVRFVVHPKLVNFMMPIDNSVYNEESKAELFNSLFGKSKN